MRRFMVLVTVVLVMTAMLAVTMAPALAIAGPPARGYYGGTALPATVCESELAASPSVGWRNGQCWVFHPAP